MSATDVIFWTFRPTKQEFDQYKDLVYTFILNTLELYFEQWVWTVEMDNHWHIWALRNDNGKKYKDRSWFPKLLKKAGDWPKFQNDTKAKCNKNIPDAESEKTLKYVCKDMLLELTPEKLGEFALDEINEDKLKLLCKSLVNIKYKNYNQLKVLILEAYKTRIECNISGPMKFNAWLNNIKPLLRKWAAENNDLANPALYEPKYDTHTTEREVYGFESGMKYFNIKKNDNLKMFIVLIGKTADLGYPLQITGNIENTAVTFWAFLRAFHNSTPHASVLNQETDVDESDDEDE